MAYGLINADTHNDSQGGVLAPISSVMRNRIINGSMTVDQRNAGASASFSSTFTYFLDRWNAVKQTGSAGTIQQSSTAPVGFVNSLVATNNATGASPSAGDANRIQTRIEGYNIADLNFGTANAKTFTLSFWVQSSVTGTYAVSFNNSAFDRSYVATYSIPVANTWTQVSVTVAGDTSGTWLTTNGIGLSVSFGLGCGSNYNTTAGAWGAGNYIGTSACVNWTATNSATFYITGVQLEKGVSATGYEYRQYQQELALCQRYAFVTTGSTSNSAYPALGSGNIQSAANARIYVKHPVDMRANPTTTLNGTVTISCDTDRASTAIGVAYTGLSSSMLGFTISSGTVGNGATAYVNGSNNYVLFSAEL